MGRNQTDTKTHEMRDINTERAHIMGNTNNILLRSVTVKFSSFKGKQIVLSDAINLKGQNVYINKDFSKETTDTREEKGKSVKWLRSQSKYAILIYDKTVVKENFRKQWLLFLLAIILEELYTFGNINPSQDLNISTGYFKKQVFNSFDFQIILIDDDNDPDIHSFDDKSKTVDSPHFSIDEFNSSSQTKTILNICFLSCILMLGV